MRRLRWEEEEEGVWCKWVIVYKHSLRAVSGGAAGPWMRRICMFMLGSIEGKAWYRLCLDAQAIISR